MCKDLLYGNDLFFLFLAFLFYFIFSLLWGGGSVFLKCTLCDAAVTVLVSELILINEPIEI